MRYVHFDGTIVWCPPWAASVPFCLLMLGANGTPHTFRVYIAPLTPLGEWQSAFDRIPRLRAVPLPPLANGDRGFPLESATARLVDSSIL